MYDAYNSSWGRAPRCDELQFHLDHSTPLDRLTDWLKGQAITEKFGCKISTTAGSDDTLLLQSPLTLGNDTDIYLTSVVQAYSDAWGRDPRCSELQFHLDHATPLDRLAAWLGENRPTTEASPVGKKVEFVEQDSKVVLEDAGAKLEFTDTDTITFAGKTAPNAFVVLTIASTESTVATTTSDADGNWSYTLPGPLEPGQHTVKVTVSDKDGKKVAESEAVPFTVVSAAQAGAPGAAAGRGSAVGLWLAVIAGVVLALLAAFFKIVKAKKA